MKALKIVLSWILVAFVMIAIFLFSNQTADVSSSVSGGIISAITDFLANLFGVPCSTLPSKAIPYHGTIRKIAHFLIYMLLGFLLTNALSVSGVKSSRRIFAISLLVAVLYAASDEFHQIFVPGRSGEIRDVIIDSTGAFSGIILRSTLWILKKQ